MKNIIKILLFLSVSFSGFSQLSGGSGTATSQTINSSLSVRRVGPQTVAIAVGNPILFTQVDSNIGTDITYNPATGVARLKSGKTYRILADMGGIYSATVTTATTNDNARGGCEFFNITANTIFGGFQNKIAYPPGFTGTNTLEGGGMGAVTATITPTVDTDIIFRVQRNNNLTGIGGNGNFYLDGNASPAWMTIDVVAGQSSVTGQSVDYLKVKRITSSQTIALSTDILFNSTPTGAIPYNSATGLATLTSGKTYKIKSRLVGRNDGTGTTQRYITYDIVTNANATLPATANPTQGTQFLATSTNNEGGGSEATAEFTPTANTDIKIRVTGIDGSNWTLDAERSYLEITQLGTSAWTGLNVTTTGSGASTYNSATSTLNIPDLSIKDRVRCSGGGVSNSFSATVTSGIFTGWTQLQQVGTSFVPATGIFTAVRAGYYRFTCGVLLSSVTGAVGQRLGIAYSVNNSTFGSNTPIHSVYVPFLNPSNFPIMATETKFLNAGDFVKVCGFLDGVTAAAISPNVNFNHLEIEEL